jgi:ATP dependent DNA ligase C terminal region
MPGNRGLWLKVKCLNREVVIGWTDPEGTRPFLGALLLGYYDANGRLTYAGRVGTGINTAELERRWRRLQPLAIDTMPLDVAPPRLTRLAHRWSSTACIGCGPRLSPKSNSSPGPTTTCCARWCTRGCARISPPQRSGDRRPITGDFGEKFEIALRHRQREGGAQHRAPPVPARPFEGRSQE